MGLLSLEHGKAAYRADFALYGSAVVGLAAFLVVSGPPAQRLEALAFAALGLGGWTAIEYALHRFLLHGIDPFKRWHEEHHRRPGALICIPTIFSASLIFVLAFVPAFVLVGLWNACALTLGVIAGYVLYGATHHAVHHWRARSPWLTRRKRWHALHHRGGASVGGYGVTTAFWDHVFGSAGTGPRAARKGP